MKKTTIMLAAILTLTGCGNRSNGTAAKNDITEKGKAGYTDLIEFICQGYECGWDEIKPDDKELSPVYTYSSRYAGFEEKDINGDGIPELLIGDQFEDGTYQLYDIYTINKKDGSLIHLAKGGERDTFAVNGEGIIIESGSNSADDSFQKGFSVKDGKLVNQKDWEDSLMNLNLQRFINLGAKRQAVGAFGEQREISAEEMAMFTHATGDGDMVFTPLSVSTQVVAGTNYKFWCRYEDKSSKTDNPSYCWVTIFKPLPGRGEPTVKSILKADKQ